MATKIKVGDEFVVDYDKYADAYPDVNIAEFTLVCDYNKPCIIKITYIHKGHVYINDSSEPLWTTWYVKDYIKKGIFTKIDFKIGNVYTVDTVELDKQHPYVPLNMLTCKIIAINDAHVLIESTYKDDDGDPRTDIAYTIYEFQDNITSGIFVIKNTINSKLYCQGNCGIPAEVRYYGPMKFYNFCTKCKKEVL